MYDRIVFKATELTKVICVLIFIILSGCVAVKPSHKGLLFDAKTGNYAHVNSGFIFPLPVGNFRLDAEYNYEYDLTGNDISVGYNLLRPDFRVAGTVYVYPALREYTIMPVPVPKFGETPEWFFEKHYDEIKTTIVQLNRAQLILEDSFKIKISDRYYDGKKAVFEYDDTRLGEKILTQLYLFANKGWFIKYRFSYPKKYNIEVMPEIEKFISTLDWP